MRIASDERLRALWKRGYKDAGPGVRLEIDNLYEGLMYSDGWCARLLNINTEDLKLREDRSLLNIDERVAKHISTYGPTG